MVLVLNRTVQTAKMTILGTRKMNQWVATSRVNSSTPVEAIGQRSDDDTAHTEREDETGSGQELVLDTQAVVVPLAEPNSVTSPWRAASKRHTAPSVTWIQIFTKFKEIIINVLLQVKGGAGKWPEHLTLSSC